jgi:hypothetical protein
MHGLGSGEPRGASAGRPTGQRGPQPADASTKNDSTPSAPDSKPPQAGKQTVAPPLGPQNGSQCVDPERLRPKTAPSTPPTSNAPLEAVAGETQKGAVGLLV